MSEHEPFVSSNESICPRCKTPFTCGAANGSAQCWCFDMPHVIPVEGIAFPGENESFTGCLCATCLQELIAHRIS